MYLAFVVGQELLALFPSLGLAAYIRVSGLLCVWCGVVWCGVVWCGVCMHACVCVRVSVCCFLQLRALSVDLDETQAVLKRDLLGILRKADSQTSDVSKRAALGPAGGQAGGCNWIRPLVTLRVCGNGVLLDR